MIRQLLFVFAIVTFVTCAPTEEKPQNLTGTDEHSPNPQKQLRERRDTSTTPGEALPIPLPLPTNPTRTARNTEEKKPDKQDNVQLTITQAHPQPVKPNPNVPTFQSRPARAALNVSPTTTTGAPSLLGKRPTRDAENEHGQPQKPPGEKDDTSEEKDDDAKH